METRDEHTAVEQVLDLMSTSLTRDGYCQRLAQFYGFYSPLEDALKAHGKPQVRMADAAHPAGARFAVDPRLSKTALLKRDLQHMAVNTDELPMCRQLPPTETRVDALGCMYVMEGATLGGRLITQHIRSALGITPATGGSFFDGYGDDTGRMWQGMRQLLASSAPDRQSQDAMVASAIATFAGLRRWCQSNRQQDTPIDTNHHA